jgi:hypothetical protein
MSEWDGLRKQIFRKFMEDYKVRYKNSKFSNEKVELDGKFFIHCEFENCIVILEKGETQISGCSFKNCKLMLKGNAYTVGRIIKLFSGKSPLRVLDMEEPLFEKGEHPFQESVNDKQQEIAVPNKNGR